jgi:hypothetical protein
MTNKSNQNGGKGRKKPVKKEKTLDELAQELYQQSLEQLNKAKEMEKIVNEYSNRFRQRHGIPNHCKTCLFQKLCPLFTDDGLHGPGCSFAPYNNEMREQLREEDPGVVYDKTLIYWKDTKEELDKRFNLN